MRGLYFKHRRCAIIAVTLSFLLLLVSLPFLQSLLQKDDYYGHSNPMPVPELNNAPVPEGGLNVVFFGFSGCGQACPLQLANMIRLQTKVDPELVHFVYVALDVDQQDQSGVDAAMRQYGPSFRGVVPKTIPSAKKLALDYGGFAYKRGERSPRWKRYNHDGRLYVVNEDNARVLTYLSPALDIVEVAKDLNRLLSEKKERQNDY